MLTDQTLTERAAQHMKKFCVDIGHRHVGSLNNKAAVDYFEKSVKEIGLKTERQNFNCIDWEAEKPLLKVDGKVFDCLTSPYSLKCDLEAELVTAATLEELKTLNVKNQILLLHGKITREQIMPKNFVFYNPDEHKDIVATLEAKQPAAIITATGHNPELAGGWYPFPMFEDGDFDIPSVYMKDVEGEKLLDYHGKKIHLKIESERIPSTGSNVIATLPGEVKDRIVFCAHIDTKKTTPGALDNGTGVTTLLLLAERLKDYKGKYTIEIAALNGEDYYSVPGQMKYLAENEKDFDTIKLVINMDAAGSKNVATAFSFYEVPGDFEEMLKSFIQPNVRCIIGDPWYQGDHSIFIQKGCPAVAITSENFVELCTNITHTEKDVIDHVDDEKLAEIAYILGGFVEAI